MVIHDFVCCCNDNFEVVICTHVNLPTRFHTRYVFEKGMYTHLPTRLHTQNNYVINGRTFM